MDSSLIVEISSLNQVDEIIEQLCNQVAAEFLCPRDTFIKDWYTHFKYIKLTLIK